MQSDVPSFARLEELATSADIRDRAFAASVLALGCPEQEPARVAATHARIRDTALAVHAGVRADIRAGTLDKQAFIARIREEPLESRDQLVEEILDVAYPPLEQASLPREAIHYCPSGLAEILFLLEHAALGPEKTFVDLGAGLGKVVLLVALLTGARAFGVELDPALVARARAAASALNLEHARFIEGDIRNAPLPAADVYYMYIPLIRSASVVERLLASAGDRRPLLFSQRLDLSQFPWLRATGSSSYWLERYEAQAANRT